MAMVDLDGFPGKETRQAAEKRTEFLVAVNDVDPLAPDDSHESPNGLRVAPARSAVEAKGRMTQCLRPLLNRARIADCPQDQAVAGRVDGAGDAIEIPDSCWVVADESQDENRVATAHS